MKTKYLTQETCECGKLIDYFALKEKHIKEGISSKKERNMKAIFVLFSALVLSTIWYMFDEQSKQPRTTDEQLIMMGFL